MKNLPYGRQVRKLIHLLIPYYTAKLSPQPQVRLALGLLK